MTAPPVFHDQPTKPGDPPPKRVQFLPTCNQSPDSHRTQVWLCFLILSVLCSMTFASSEPDIGLLKGCLDKLKNAVEKSDAMLYAPSVNDIKVSYKRKDCETIVLSCYMKELQMVLEELEIRGVHALCISEFKDRVQTPHHGSCPPCEAYALKNSTIFLERLYTLLEKLNSIQISL